MTDTTTPATGSGPTPVTAPPLPGPRTSSTVSNAPTAREPLPDSPVSRSVNRARVWRSRVITGVLGSGLARSRSTTTRARSISSPAATSFASNRLLVICDMRTKPKTTKTTSERTSVDTITRSCRERRHTPPKLLPIRVRVRRSLAVALLGRRRRGARPRPERSVTAARLCSRHPSRSGRSRGSPDQSPPWRAGAAR